MSNEDETYSTLRCPLRMKDCASDSDISAAFLSGPKPVMKCQCPLHFPVAKKSPCFSQFSNSDTWAVAIEISWMKHQILWNLKARDMWLFCRDYHRLRLCAGLVLCNSISGSKWMEDVKSPLLFASLKSVQWDWLEAHVQQHVKEVCACRS